MRRIIDADIQFISLCPRGANGFVSLFKSDQTAEFRGLTRALEKFEERGQLVACVYAPNHVDRQGDWADAATVEKMAHSFIKNGASIDLMHNGKKVSPDEAYVAESFIIQKGDARFEGMKTVEGEAVDVTGGWGVVFQIDSPELRKDYREGKWNGVSMAGPAKVIDEDLTKMTPDAALEAIRKLFQTNTTNGDTDMKREEIEALVKSTVEETVKGVVEALKPEAPETPEGGKVEKNDEPTLDVTDPKAVLEHARKAALKKAHDDADLTTAEGRTAYTEAVAAIEKEFAGEGESNEPAKAAKKKPAASNVAKGEETDEDSESEDDELLKMGDDLAKYITDRRMVRA